MQGSGAGVKVRVAMHATPLQQTRRTEPGAAGQVFKTFSSQVQNEIHWCIKKLNKSYPGVEWLSELSGLHVLRGGFKVRCSFGCDVHAQTEASGGGCA